MEPPPTCARADPAQPRLRSSTFGAGCRRSVRQLRAAPKACAVTTPDDRRRQHPHQSDDDQRDRCAERPSPRTAVCAGHRNNPSAADGEEGPPDEHDGEERSLNDPSPDHQQRLPDLALVRTARCDISWHSIPPPGHRWATRPVRSRSVEAGGGSSDRRSAPVERQAGAVPKLTMRVRGQRRSRGHARVHQVALRRGRRLPSARWDRKARSEVAERDRTAVAPVVTSPAAFPRLVLNDRTIRLGGPSRKGGACLGHPCSRP
jgi:hypothetical protein